MIEQKHQCVAAEYVVTQNKTGREFLVEVIHSTIGKNQFAHFNVWPADEQPVTARELASIKTEYFDAAVT